jgi:hypothetical protein
MRIVSKVKNFIRPIAAPLTVARVVENLRSNLEDLSTIVDRSRAMAKIEQQLAAEALQRVSEFNRVAEEALRIRQAVLNSL